MGLQTKIYPHQIGMDLIPCHQIDPPPPPHTHTHTHKVISSNSVNRVTQASLRSRTVWVCAMQGGHVCELSFHHSAACLALRQGRAGFVPLLPQPQAEGRWAIPSERDSVNCIISPVMVSFIILAGKCIVCADPHETVYFDAKKIRLLQDV